MRLSEELARIIPARRRRRPAEQAPREIVPSQAFVPATGREPGRDAFDAARERLKAQIPPPPADGGELGA